MSRRKPNPNPIPALLSSDVGVGAGSRRKSVLGLDKAPSWMAWHFKHEGPPALSGGASKR